MKRSGWLLGIALLGIALLAGCAAPPSPFPPLEQPLNDARVLELLEQRTALPGYSGMVSMDYADPEVEATLDAVVNWKPAHLRVTAFKELVVTEYDVFDLLLVPDGYAMRYLNAEREDVLVRGTVEEFTRQRARQAGFYWVGEAMLLPGRTVGTPQVRRPSDDVLEVAGILHSGAEVVFRLVPETLEVREARIRVPGKARTIALTYGDYAKQGEAFVPQRVEITDPALEVAVTVELDEGEPAGDFAGYVFDLDDVGSE